ncbi:asparagine synthase (glutamine-hydrolyzing) [Alphaproteobacteria bacterium]|nr:asparagine synthase (glutamine-hydrolyzing) [Alphaproteobacteria bacterium]
MCGITGFFQPTCFSSAFGEKILKKMVEKIRHRGPDDQGIWLDEHKGIGLAHQRLSILDLSPTGHQPMESSSGRYLIVFNGEIYNHLDLRKTLIGSHVHWRGRSDTETLLAGFEQWGIQATIEKCIGMFAFGVWDRQVDTLTLCRDRMGEKPLYFGWQGVGEEACFLFGSELKALKNHPSFSGEVDRDALCLFMRYGNVPAPQTIYKGISKLEPGHLLTISVEDRRLRINPYWSLETVAVMGSCYPTKNNEELVINELEQLLMSAVKQQMIADVSVGAFLSGGIDSSTIVALMQAQSSTPIQTFSIGFGEQNYNEAVQAKEVANYLGTDHTELYVTPRETFDVISKLPNLYCEPFGDSSQIPTYLVSQLARQSVKVSLSGDGGDEIFGGYNRYFLTEKIWNKMSHVPIEIRRFLALIIQGTSPDNLNKVINPLQKFLPKSLRSINTGDKLHKAAEVLASSDIDELYLGIVSHWKSDEIVLAGVEPEGCLSRKPSNFLRIDDVQKMMLLDSVSYLPNDILVKLDRAAMGASLETRIPFLDHRVIEFAWQIPQSMKLRQDTGKWILREVLHRHVPKSIVDRPKMGFGIPIDSWLRGPLKDWAEDLLNENRLIDEGFFNSKMVREKWTEHLSRKKNWHHLLWNVLMFQAWLEVQ